MTVVAAVRDALLGAFLAMAALTVRAAVPASEPGDMTLGSPSAPVEVIEYASVGCPHCAAWANDVLPAFKKQYIDTGQARLVVRIMLTGDPDLAMAGFLLARCAGPSRYFDVMDQVYRRQASMYQPGASPGPILEQIAASAGVGAAAFKACMHSHKGFDAVNALNQRHFDQDKVQLTPTFFVGDKRFEGDVSLAELGEAVRAAHHGP